MLNRDWVMLCQDRFLLQQGLDYVKPGLRWVLQSLGVRRSGLALAGLDFFTISFGLNCDIRLYIWSYNQRLHVTLKKKQVKQSFPYFSR